MLANVVREKEWHCIHTEAVCTLIKLGSCSGLHPSPSSLLPHLRDQHATHNCLPFSLAVPLLILTWPRRGITGVTALTVRAGYRYYTFQERCVISLHFLRNNSACWSLLLYIPKTSICIHYFSQKRSLHE
jgi:hypothetical protein